VYRLSDDVALVTTVDVITPPVNDPFQFGRIAACNALSDVYAMGARPITALQICGFPADVLGQEVLEAILQGSAAAIAEANCVVAGGHTTKDDEPKFGLAVTGLVHPDRYWANAGARVGDALILTKPIGTGVLLNGNKKGWVSAGALAACVASLGTLNRIPAEVLANFTVHAATDVTGFGLAGHAYEMAQASDVQLDIDFGILPLLDEAMEMYERGVGTSVNLPNRTMVEPGLSFGREFSAPEQQMMVDPQTNGGLLAAIPASEADEAVTRLRDAGCVHTVQIGVVEPGSGLHFR
jgi:selenide,water dikinase